MENYDLVWTYNQFHNISRLFDGLPSSPFTTSETMADYYLYTWYIRVTSRVAERRQRSQDIRKYQESAQTPQKNSPAPSHPAKMKGPSTLAKNSWKPEIKPPRCAPPHTKTRASLKYFSIADCKTPVTLCYPSYTSPHKKTANEQPFLGI